MTDFIIVGRGLAANVLAHTFHKNKIGFKIIGKPGLSRSSQVAAGIYNPVVFKRMTKSWLASINVPFLEQFFSECENTLQVKLLYHREMIKPFVQDQEKKLWLKKAELELDEFLDEKIYKSNGSFTCLKTEEEYGKVKHAGNVDMEKFLSASSDFFADYISEETFEYEALTIGKDFVRYKNTEAKNIVFCEGYMVKNNPWFKWIPLKPVKGDTFVIVSEKIRLKNSIFNKDGFLMDLGENKFKVGATYNWNDLNDEAKDDGKRALEEKLQKMISCDYRILSHDAGVRPSSADRRPIIGPHPLHPNLFVFNGLGAKGVMLAPYFANNFVNCLQHKEKLHPEISVQRFYQLFEIQ